MLALYTAASGMAAMEKNVELISNNVANVRTTGYKTAPSLSRPPIRDPEAFRIKHIGRW